MLPKTALSKAWIWNRLGDEDAWHVVRRNNNTRKGFYNWGARLYRPLLLKDSRAAIMYKNCMGKTDPCISYLLRIQSRAGKLVLLPLARQGLGLLTGLCCPGAYRVASSTTSNPCKEEPKSQAGHFFPVPQPFLSAWQGNTDIWASHWTAHQQAISLCHQINQLLLNSSLRLPPPLSFH